MNYTFSWADLLAVDLLAVIDKGSLAGALVILVIHLILGLWVSLGRFLFGLINAKKDRKRRLSEVIVDIIIDAQFTHQSITQTTAPDAITEIKKQIRNNPSGYRAYVAFVQNDPTFDEYRSVRRFLHTPLMAACDLYFDLSQLFQKYYEKLESNEFLELSCDRKIAVINNLCFISEQTRAAYEALQQELENSPETSEIFKVTMEHLQKGHTG